ncbi:MAG: hypothetical protein KDG55_16975 [Rhodocyclaceae bacterium]|nr:hypothetical protein [Rhodocyclaceae bacterium]
MSTRLLVLIDEHWPSRPSAPWVVLDEAGRVQSEGESEPKHWPAASECAFMMAGSQCAWHQARLPRGARREEGRLLAYALEDRLLRDPESQHLVVTDREPGPDGVTVRVLVTARERLRALVAQLAAIGRPPVAACSELQSAPAGGKDWHLAIAPHALTLRSGPTGAEALDPPLAGCQPLLAHALAAARAADSVPARLVLHRAPGADDAALEGEALGITLAEGEPYRWWAGAAGATNLLQGEFAPRHRRAGWIGRLGWPLRLAAAALVVMVLADVGEVLWQRHRLGELDARMTRLFESALPRTPAVAPAAQLARQVDALRGSRGQLRSDDLLALLAAYASARGVATRDSIASLEFREGRLALELPALGAAERAALRERLSAQGYVARDQADPPRLLVQVAVDR